MDGPQEYEVESITRARVHDKKGKKITWKYYVKWKGYSWDDSTWEPQDSFQGGSEHILESFWERIDTGGRDISDATAFKKGEELLISGPPGGKSLKRKTGQAKTRGSSSKGIPGSDDVVISAPPLTTRKRRRVQITLDGGGGYSKPKRMVSTTNLENGGSSSRSPKRRRASSPGLRKSAPKRMPSAGDSQLDADGETDPDVVEVEDELMQVSVEDAEEENARMRRLAIASRSASGSQQILFDDLEHFYSGNPIDIDQPTDEQVTTQRPETRPRLQSPPPTVLTLDGGIPNSRAPGSPTLNSSDPLFGSPPRISDEPRDTQRDMLLPPHRARVTNPLIKPIDTSTSETTGKQSRIATKARLMSIHATDSPSTSGSSRGITKRDRKPGPGRPSFGFIAKNRSSLLTATKGVLKSVKGTFAGTTIERDQREEIEGASVACGETEEDELVITTRSDGDPVVDQGHQAVSKSQPSPPPSGGELLKLAGLQTDTEALPDYEDDSVERTRDAETQRLNLTLVPAKEELTDQSSAEVTEEHKANSRVPDAPPSVPEARQKAPTPISMGPSVPQDVAPPANEAVKKNIELAKEHLFPFTQASFDSFGTTHSSFRSTIFGPLYQGFAVNHAPVATDAPSTAFKVIIRDGVELPLVLKDCSEIKTRMNDIMIGNSSGSKVALFYSAEDALAMVSTFKGDGTARVVLDPSAKTTQQECFSTFLERFESSQTLVAPVGKEVCVLYSADNADIAEKLGAPARLRGLSSTLLISHASIENQLAYVAAVMKATAL